ncbi:MAG: rhodanese-like domain-containing protein [Brumimicrobium sp.]
MNTDKKIIDVRSPMEFLGGNISGSINIPLQEIPDRIQEIKSMGETVFCCASGNRSGQAVKFLKSHGVSCENGGGWMELNYKLQTT